MVGRQLVELLQKKRLNVIHLTPIRIVVFEGITYMLTVGAAQGEEHVTTRFWLPSGIPCISKNAR